MHVPLYSSVCLFQHVLYISLKA